MVIRMATSSIFRNIIIEDEEKIEKFVEALEKAKAKAQAENRKVSKSVYRRLKIQCKDDE